MHNALFNQSLLNEFLHFQKCLQHNNILTGKHVDHVLSEEKTKSILPASQHTILFYPKTSRKKDPVAALFKHVYKDSCSISSFL